MTRASYAGGQRYAVTWTGDNSSTWDHLRLCVEQLTNLGLSGFAYSGCDVGGFIGGASPDLLTRWYEIAAFTPVFRNHSAHDAPKAEPWVDGPDHLAIRRRFIEERYRLMPYLYALADQNSRTGDPRHAAGLLRLSRCVEARLRPVDGVHRRPRLACGRSSETGITATFQCLPARRRLVRLLDGSPAERAQALAAAEARLRAGVCSRRHDPSSPAAGSKHHGDPQGPARSSTCTRATVVAAASISTTESRSADHSLRQTIQCTVTPNGVALRFGPREGLWRPWWKQIAVTVHGTEAARTLIPDQPRAAEVLIR